MYVWRQMKEDTQKMCGRVHFVGGLFDSFESPEWNIQNDEA